MPSATQVRAAALTGCTRAPYHLLSRGRDRRRALRHLGTALTVRVIRDFLQFTNKVKNRVTLTWQLQAGVDSGVLDHRGRVAAVVHVQLRTLSLPVDDSQTQAEPLGVRLGPERKAEGRGEIRDKKSQASLLHHFTNHTMDTPFEPSGCTREPLAHNGMWGAGQNVHAPGGTERRRGPAPTPGNRGAALRPALWRSLQKKQLCWKQACGPPVSRVLRNGGKSSVPSQRETERLGEPPAAGDPARPRCRAGQDKDRESAAREPPRPHDARPRTPHSSF